MSQISKEEKNSITEFYIKEANRDRHIEHFRLNNDKKLDYILCYKKNSQKTIIMNIMIALDKKVIVDNIADMFLFKAELDLFHNNEDSKYFELKSKKIDNKTIYSLKVKGQKIYFRKTEAKSITELIRHLISGCSSSELISFRKYQSYEKWEELLEEKGFSN